MELVDKISEMQVIGCLMQDSLLLAQVDKYHLEVRDFYSKFTRIIFSAINNIYLDGAKSISEIEIGNYLEKYIDLKTEFENQKGIEFLQQAEEIATLDNFNYYYGRLKKFSCLRSLKAEGFDISNFYCENVLDPKYREKQEHFDEMNVSDIFDEVKKKLAVLEEGYNSGANNESGFIADGLKALRESFKTIPDIGFPLQGAYYNTVVKGARKGKYYLRSAGTGTGKTRLAVGDACNLAYPVYYDWNKKAWMERQYTEKVLFITTELDKSEVQTMVISWMSGINEDKLRMNKMTFEEEAITDQAIQYIEKFEDNFRIVHIPDPSIGQVEAAIRKEVLVGGIQNVFYDYIFSSPSLLAEFAGLKLREDVVLCMLSTALKDLAVELGVFLASSTQISGEIDEKKGIRTQSFIRGAKSIADKVDVGCITVSIGVEEQAIVTPIVNQLGKKMPNLVTDIYKVRGGRYKNVKVWSYADLGTCRCEDILITDGYYNVIPNFEVLKYSDWVSPSIEEELIEEESYPEECFEKPEIEPEVPEKVARKLSDLF